MTTPVYPIPMLLWCPECGERHLDDGEWAIRIHHTHACQFCGMVWRPAVVPTVGVQFLPGFHNESPEASDRFFEPGPQEGQSVSVPMVTIDPSALNGELIFDGSIHDIEPPVSIPMKPVDPGTGSNLK